MYFTRHASPTIQCLWWLFGLQEKSETFSMGAEVCANSPKVNTGTDINPSLSALMLSVQIHWLTLLEIESATSSGKHIPGIMSSSFPSKVGPRIGWSQWRWTPRPPSSWHQAEEDRSLGTGRLELKKWSRWNSAYGRELSQMMNGWRDWTGLMGLK